VEDQLLTMLIFITFENLTKSVEVGDESLEGLIDKVYKIFEISTIELDDDAIIKIPLSLYNEENILIDDVKGLSDLQKIKLKFKDVKDLSKAEIEVLTSFMKDPNDSVQFSHRIYNADFILKIKEQDFPEDIEFYIFKVVIANLNMYETEDIEFPLLNSLVAYICYNHPDDDEGSYYYLLLDYLFDNLINVDLEATLPNDGNYDAFDIDGIFDFYPTSYMIAKLYENDILMEYLSDKGCDINPDVLCNISVCDRNEQMEFSFDELLEPKCGAFYRLIHY